jgi:5-methyltetrahydropteroyltriglutamate--homocysteine methyltransferase
MQDTTAPFRADHVGSFLRSPELKAARAKREAGQLTAEQLKAIEDREIKALIAKQAEVGLKLATDGELRRKWWHYDFYFGLDGIERYQLKNDLGFHGAQAIADGIRVAGKIDFSTHPFLEHSKFLRANTKAVAKMTIPSPTVLHFRLERDGVLSSAYQHRDDILEDLGNAYAKAVHAFYQAGCRYLQFDDTAFAYLCSAEEMVKAKTRGINTERVARQYADLVNMALKDKPADMVITTHICRGNFRSTWIASGGYEPVAEILFGGTDYDGFFLEYDSERAGGFEPLRFLPKGKKRMVLGLITSKTGELENRDVIKRRIEEATKYVALDQCCLSTQCGFASTEEGNVLSDAQQWAKLREVVAIAGEVWGGVSARPIGAVAGVA